MLIFLIIFKVQKCCLNYRWVFFLNKDLALVGVGGYGGDGARETTVCACVRVVNGEGDIDAIDHPVYLHVCLLYHSVCMCVFVCVYVCLFVLVFVCGYVRLLFVCVDKNKIEGLFKWK